MNRGRFIPQIPLAEKLKVEKAFYNWFLNLVSTCGPVSDECIKAAIAVDINAYRKFVSAALAIAQFHADVIAAFAKRLRNNPEFDSNKVLGEMLEWISPAYTAHDFKKYFLKLSELSCEEFDKLMEVYATTYPQARNAGDGYFPPFAMFADVVMFSPYVVQSMLSTRNILYCISKTDKKHFDNFVSAHMEPHLVAEAKKEFTRLQGIKIECNVNWGAGEFDMLVYSPTENTVLTIQAKASIPPDGARMTQRTEDRILEGLDQLDRFVALDQQQQDRILSSAFGQPVSNAKVVKVVLGWSGFGTMRVWKRMTDVAPLNISLLKHMATNGSLCISGIVETVYRLIDEIVENSEAQWKQDEFDLGVAKLTMPQLKFNTISLLPYMNR